MHALSESTGKLPILAYKFRHALQGLALAAAIALHFSAVPSMGCADVLTSCNLSTNAP